MKTILLASILSIFSLKSTAQNLIGKWQLQSINTSFTTQSGKTKDSFNNIKEKGVNITWEFQNSGKLITKDGTNTVNGTWTLKGSQLILKGEWAKETAVAFGMNELIYEVESAGNTIKLSVDATKMGNYKKHILTYTYLKL
jgi:heat shock protein HslJ